ncbi:MAG: choice-of-anchor E domain-containing protein [Kiritimatiellales bacterium]|nr:choice-of-anchor E domain-containing protein [Kiritimatiellales bacterium]MCF7863742.1 choice-of-anchor E domain-containing protein [Kiritimatiellales bacterium]
MNTGNMIKGIVCGATLLMASGIAQAAVITQTKTFSGQPNYSSPLTFNKFNDNGGTYTLNSILITVQLNTEAGATLGIDNDGVDPASGSVEFGSSGSITSSDVTLAKAGGGLFLASLSSITTKNMNLSGDDGDTTVYSTLGTDFDSLVTTATSTSDSTFINSFFFNEYTGVDAYTITYGVNQFINMGAFSGAQFQGNPVGANGSITIEYDYAIPEPASIAMIGVIAGACIFIRRMFLI